MNQLNTSPNQPLYLYQMPMFKLTVSVVLIIENGVVVVEKKKAVRQNDSEVWVLGGIEDCCFPSGVVKAGQETIQFAAVRIVKEQTGIVLKKALLIPVDFRSSPERSKEGNEVDLGFVCILENVQPNCNLSGNARWIEVDFEEKQLLKNGQNINFSLYMDHGTLLQRAIDMSLMIKL